MKIQAIEWISKDAEEATILVSDGKYACWCFCHPCIAKIGDTVSMLYALDSTGIKVATKKSFYINKHSVGFGHDYCGQLSDKNKSIVSIGGISIEIDGDIPGDIEQGDCIEFTCARVDAWIA